LSEGEIWKIRQALKKGHLKWGNLNNNEFLPLTPHDLTDKFRWIK